MVWFFNNKHVYRKVNELNIKFGSEAKPSQRWVGSGSGSAELMTTWESNQLSWPTWNLNQTSSARSWSTRFMSYNKKGITLQTFDIKLLDWQVFPIWYDMARSLLFRVLYALRYYYYDFTNKTKENMKKWGGRGNEKGQLKRK